MFRRVLSAWLLPRRRRLGNGVRLEPRGDDSFLEGMVVLAIVAILVALAFATYRLAPTRAAMSEAANIMIAFKVEIATELAVTGRMPETILPWEPPAEFSGRYFSGLEWRDNEIVAPFRSGIMPAVDASLPFANAEPWTLSFRVARSTELGRPLILCGHADPPPGFEVAPPQHTSMPEEFLPFFCRI